MKLPDPRKRKTMDIFRPYLRKSAIFNEIPLQNQTNKEALKDNATKEAHEAFEKWKEIVKKEMEEEAKIGIVF